LAIYQQYAEEQLIWHNVAEAADTSGILRDSSHPLVQRDLPNGPPLNWYIEVKQSWVRLLDASANGSFKNLAIVWLLTAELEPNKYPGAEGRSYKPNSFVAALAGSKLIQLSRADHPDVWQKVSDPSKCDIAATVVGDIAAQWADGSNWIAVPSKRARNLLLSLEESNDLPGVLMKLERFGVTSFSKSEGWLVATAQDPYLEQEVSCDVRTLSTLVAAGLEKGFIDLSDCLKFARVNENLGSATTILKLLNIDHPSSLQNYQVYRAFAHLSPSTISHLSNGGSLEVRSAPRRTRDALNKLLMSDVLKVQTGRGGYYPIEPTTAFVDGVPLSAVISGSRTTYPVVIAHREVRPGETVRSIEGTRMMSYVHWWKRIVTDGELLGFTIGEAHALGLRIDYAPGAWHSFRLHDLSVRPRQDLTAYEDLPKEVRQLIDAYRRAHQYRAGGRTRH
ncbi:MAG: hypothetical protein IIC73_04720, partial [Armatimonadetes bacterium]|nr:hypothetical protein [Armatimonadota bacterium]